MDRWFEENVFTKTNLTNEALLRELFIHKGTVPHLNPHWKYTYYVARTCLEKYHVSVTYSKDSVEDNYLEYSCNRTGQIFAIEDLIETLIRELGSLIRKKLYSQVELDENVRSRISTKGCLLVKFRGIYYFSTQLVRLCLEQSLAWIFINHRIAEKPPFISTFLTDIHKNYGIVTSYRSNDGNALEKGMLDIICQMYPKVDKTIIIDTYCRLVQKHVLNNVLGHQYGIFHLNQAEDNVKDIPLTNRDFYIVTDEFFLIGFSFFRHFWKAPVIARGHHNHPTRNEFMNGYFCFPSSLKITNPVKLAKTVDPDKNYYRNQQLRWRNDKISVIAFVNDYIVNKHLYKPWKWSSGMTGVNKKTGLIKPEYLDLERRDLFLCETIKANLCVGVVTS